MIRRTNLLFALMVITPAFTLSAQEDFQGSHTLVICESDVSGKEMDANFKELFPDLFIAMERRRQEGIVTDVYFMSAIVEGVVFFATDKGGDSESNADMVIAEMQEMLKESKTEHSLSCDTTLVGPKAGE